MTPRESPSVGESGDVGLLHMLLGADASSSSVEELKGRLIPRRAH